MDIKRILTSVLGLPAVIAILVFGNTIVIDIFFAIIAVISIKEYFDAFEKTGNAKPIRWIGYYDVCNSHRSIFCNSFSYTQFKYENRYN